MKSVRRLPALEKALAYLAENGWHTWPSSLRRPSIRELAKRADVSYVTMWKAVHEANRSGHMHRSTASTEPSMPRGPRWEATFYTFLRDLRSGEFPPGSVLPKAALLQQRYGVSLPTLRRALMVACSEGLVDMYNRGYRVRNLGREVPHAMVCIVARRSAPGEIHTSSYYAFIREAEQACSRAGVSPRIISYAIDGGWGRLLEDDREIIEHLNTRPNVLGAIVIDRGLEPHVTVPLVERFTRHEKPVAILWERDQGSIPSSLTRNPYVRFFPYAHSPRAGHAVGRYLASQRHQRIAYLAAWGEPVWSTNRLEGLRAALAVHGPAGQVVVQPTIGPLLTTGIMRLRTEIAILMRTLQEKPVAGDNTTPDRLLSRLRQLTDDFHNALRQQLSPSAFSYECLLRDRRITAWVGANDDIALDALRYLRNHDIAVPHEISVVGFDDTEEAFIENLTSYNFNRTAVMHAMVHWVLGFGRIGSGRKETEPSEIDGYICQRKSSGKARGSD